MISSDKDMASLVCSTDELFNEAKPETLEE
jgi:hypothetical protein